MIFFGFDLAPGAPPGSCVLATAKPRAFPVFPDFVQVAWIAQRRFRPQVAMWNWETKNWMVVSKNVWFSSLFGEDEPILTHIFQLGWNYHLEEVPIKTWRPKGGAFFWGVGKTHGKTYKNQVGPVDQTYPKNPWDVSLGVKITVVLRPWNGVSWTEGKGCFHSFGGDGFLGYMFFLNNGNLRDPTPPMPRGTPQELAILRVYKNCLKFPAFESLQKNLPKSLLCFLVGISTPGGIYQWCESGNRPRWIRLESTSTKSSNQINIHSLTAMFAPPKEMVVSKSGISGFPGGPPIFRGYVNLLVSGRVIYTRCFQMGATASIYGLNDWMIDWSIGWLIGWLVYLSTYQSIDLCIYLSMVFFYLSIYLSIYLSTYLPTYLSIYLSIYLPTYLPI